MDKDSDVTKSIQSCKEEIASLKATIESLKDLILQVPRSKQQTGFTEIVDSKTADPNLMTRKEIEEIREYARFSIETTACGQQQSKDQSAPMRFIEFRLCDGMASSFLNKTYGVYTLPVTGRYRFGLKGDNYQPGSSEWFLCCDGDDAEKRRPVNLDFDEDYQTFENEKRLSMFTLDEDTECCEKFVGFYGQEGMNVWSECYKIDKDKKLQAKCVFSGAFVE